MLAGSAIGEEVRRESLAAVDAVADDLERAAGDLADVHGASLGHGVAGCALLFDALERSGRRPGAGKVARSLLQAATRAERGRRSTSLYGGWPGVALAISVVLEEDEADRALAPADAALARATARLAWSGPFDLMEGLVGLGVLAAARLPRPGAAGALAAVVRHLDALALPDREGLAWRDPAYPGEVDTGMAHGVAGVTALLALALRTGAEPKRAVAALEGAVAWLLGAAAAHDPVPGVLRDEGDPREFGFDAWCHGDPGVAGAVLAAADAAGREDWRRAGLDVAERAARRPVADVDPGVAGACHGAGGLALLYARLERAGASGAGAAADAWARRALALRRPETGIGGFADPGPVPGPAPGLLFGAAGAVLGLLGACGLGATGWERALLLCDEDTR